MPGRKSVWPGNAERDRRKQVNPQAMFQDVYEDPPPSLVPESALAKSINGWPIGMGGWRPRNGTKLYGVQYPAITGRTGYVAHKAGNLIISDSGDIFTDDDVSNYWVWDNGLTDEMTEFISANTMRCRDSDPNTGFNCHVQGKLNLNVWHDKAGKWILQLGEELFTAPRNKSYYTKVLNFGFHTLQNTRSEMIEDGDNAIVQNNRYMYHVLLKENPIRCYPKSTPVPYIRIESNTEEGERQHKYRYLYSCALLEQGPGNFYNRETQVSSLDAVKILTESGTNLVDSNRRDWAEINTDNAIGPRLETYGRLIGTVLVNPYNAPAGWTGITDITLRISINNLGYAELVIDGSLINTLTDLAERIQTAGRIYFPSMTCEYLSDATVGPHFMITSGIVEGGAVAVLEGITGTPSAVNLGLMAGTTESPYLGVPKTVRTLYMPIATFNADGSSSPQRHWSHYVINRCPDLGPRGISDEQRKGSTYYSHLNTIGKRIVNSPDEFTWNKDLRAAAAFIARRINGYIELRADVLGGQFEMADEGCVVEFEDGSRVEIMEGGFINSKLVRYAYTPDYYGDETDWMAAEIGDGRVLRVIQTGDIVNRVVGSSPVSYTAFTAADERSMVWFPDGTRDWIKEVINANSVRLYNSNNRDVTGMTFQPTHRNYTDIVYDQTLFERASAWSCKNRFLREVRTSNMIALQPGYVISAARGNKQVFYCPLEPSYRQFVGYHHWQYQTIELEDVIERLIGFTNRYSALCKGSIYSGATNNSTEYTIPETLQILFIISGMERLSTVGLINYGSLSWVDNEWVRFVTNTGEVRDFNGIQFVTGSGGDPMDYSEDRASGLGRFSKPLKRAYQVFNSIYARGVGYLLWWRT